MTDTDESVRGKSVVETVKTLLPDIQHVETIVQGCEPGNNYMSLVYRVLVRFKQSLELQWLFVKCCSKDEQLTEWADFNIAFRNESGGYKHLQDLELPLTKCYLAQQDIIVLKDLVSDGYKMADKYQGFNLAQSHVILEKLARFHGNSIRLRSRNMNAFENLCLQFQDLSIYFDKIPSQYFDEMIENIGEVNDDMRERLNGYRDRKIFELVIQCLTLNKRKKEHALLGIIHGDFWVNNIMLREEEYCKPDAEGDSPLIDVKVVDLQSIDVNSVLVDLMTLLITSINLPVLLEHYPHFIQHYHQNLNLPHLSLDQFLFEMDMYKPFFLPVFLWRALPTRSSTKEQYKENFRLFNLFLSKYGFI